VQARVLDQLLIALIVCHLVSEYLTVISPLISVEDPFRAEIILIKSRR